MGLSFGGASGGLEPACLISVGGEDVTARFMDRLRSITVTDNSGEASDEVEIELDDRGNVLAEPRRGAAITVAMGYVGQSLYPVGKFVVDECWPEGPPDILKIKGKSADMRAGLKSAKSRAWRETTVGAVVAKIAGEHGLTPAVAGGLSGQPVDRDQTGESDLNFLTRLGRDYGAVAAPKGGVLVFAPAASGLSSAGRALAAVTLNRSDLTSWRGVAADRANYGTVKARYPDRTTGRDAFVTTGSGDPIRTLRTLYPSQAAATAAAAAELARLGRASGGVELVLPGRAQILAQTPVTLTGLRASLCRRWIATTVEHRMDFTGGGFTTSVTANATGKAD